MLKEIIIPRDSDKKLYTYAVVMILATSVMLLGLIPWSEFWYAVNVPLALLLGLAVFSLAPFAILIGGWSSNNKYTVIGGMRGAAQLIAYEVPLLLVVVSIVIMVGSLNFNDIVTWQIENVWLIAPLILGCITFFVAGLAEVERVPFDLPEAEAELVEGWQTEYGGFRWGLIMLCDYVRAYIVALAHHRAVPRWMGWAGAGATGGLDTDKDLLGLLRHGLGPCGHGPYQDRPDTEDRLEAPHAPGLHQPGHRRVDQILQYWVVVSWPRQRRRNPPIVAEMT